ncbi:acyltransferase family protein [Catellatospora tritici]|uniref:acyltransferase family protein n=1 Tax=Catellatospora tritici TaxID=2851566 RepID=UPI001C2D4131|nr:acyltransferase family protein [Catellatospora tritici]MBV1856607.1 acyltransferase family protein [Catellatospora tritici]
MSIIERTAPVAAPVATARARSPYVDTLRAAAIVRVFLNHAIPIGALTALFPSMWLMFGLAGFLTAASLERGGGGRTVRSRLRRLLPPLWALGAVALPLMLLNGWLHDPQQPMRWFDPLLWVLPLANPPASTWGGIFVVTLWYLRAYLWFVLMAPALWWLMRRWPVPTLLAPLALAVACSSAFTVPSNPVGDVIWTTAAYGTAWLLGYARHRRVLDRVPLAAVFTIGAALGVMALRSNGSPLSQVLWGTAVVLVVLRLRPSMTWYDRLPDLLRRAVALLNARAVTLYVWQFPMIFVGHWLINRTGIPALTDSAWVTLLVTIPLTALAVLCFGWVEDVAANRAPRLLPAIAIMRPQPQPAAG